MQIRGAFAGSMFLLKACRRPVPSTKSTKALPGLQAGREITSCTRVATFGLRCAIEASSTIVQGCGDQATLDVVRFRTLSDAQIERYLQREPAYDCAGSAKSEGLGISLLEAIEGGDPTALVGLPLIALTGLLGAAGIEIP